MRPVPPPLSSYSLVAEVIETRTSRRWLPLLQHTPGGAVATASHWGAASPRPAMDWSGCVALAQARLQRSAHGIAADAEPLEQVRGAGVGH